MLASNLAAIMGALLIVSGIAQVYYQMIFIHNKRVRKDEEYYRDRPQIAHLGFTTWRIQTAYPGITMICVGAILLGVGGFVAPHSN